MEKRQKQVEQRDETARRAPTPSLPDLMRRAQERHGREDERSIGLMGSESEMKVLISKSVQPLFCSVFVLEI